MKEQIKTIYESLLVVTGYTRHELNTRYAIQSDKRLAQNVLIRMLLKLLKQVDVVRLTGINGNAIAKIKTTDPTKIESIIFKVVWSLYTTLMHGQVEVKDFTGEVGATVKQLVAEDKAVITMKDLSRNIKLQA